jgi:phosphopantothenoylcysteine decarboxylase/phosphopantothenate--cysteine ligase
MALLLFDHRRAGRHWRNDLVGRRVVVSAGGTREPLDPVRFLGNRSSGRQGIALARVAAARGADVTVVAANVTLEPPPGVRLVTVSTTEQLRGAMLVESGGSNALHPADVVIMAAAPADFQPVAVAAHKIKKIGDGVPQLELRRTPDVLAELVAHRVGGQVIVGFAAETGDAEADTRTHAIAKLKAKGCDLLVLNEVGDGRGFEVGENAATILSPDSDAIDVPFGSKDELAAVILDVVVTRLR